MKLIYIDPGCSGMQVKPLKTDSVKEIQRILADEGLEPNNCADYIYYVVIGDDGSVRKGGVDFT